MISKELLEKILGKEVGKVEVKGNTLWFNDADPRAMSYKWSEFCINIYELMAKAKEWANNRPHKRYQLVSYRAPISIGGGVCEVYSGAIRQGKDIEADTEYEAVFKACEWILKEKAK